MNETVEHEAVKAAEEEWEEDDDPDANKGKG